MGFSEWGGRSAPPIRNRVKDISSDFKGISKYFNWFQLRLRFGQMVRFDSVCSRFATNRIHVKYYTPPPSHTHTRPSLHTHTHTRPSPDPPERHFHFLSVVGPCRRVLQPPCNYRMKVKVPLSQHRTEPATSSTVHWSSTLGQGSL